MAQCEYKDKDLKVCGRSTRGGTAFGQVRCFKHKEGGGHAPCACGARKLLINPKCQLCRMREYHRQYAAARRARERAAHAPPAIHPRPAAVGSTLE